MAEVSASSPVAAALSAQPAAHGKAAQGGGGLFSQLLAGQAAQADGTAALQAGLPLPAMLAQADAPGLAGLFTAIARRAGRSDAEEAAFLAGDPALQSAQGAALLALLADAQQGLDPALAADPQALAGKLLSLAGVADGSRHARPAKAADLAAAGQELPVAGQGGEPVDLPRVAVGQDTAEAKSPAFGAPLPGLADALPGEEGAPGVKALPLAQLAPPPASGQPGAMPDDPARLLAGVAHGAGPAATEDVAAMDIRIPVRAPGWEADLGQKVVWLAGRQSQFAELSLNPPHLGSIEVRLSLSGQEAGAQFFSPNPTVRDAIEAAIPRLREMMAQAGLSLGQASVSPESFQGRQETAQEQRGYAQAGRDEAGAILDARERPVAGRGLVDLFV